MSRVNTNISSLVSQRILGQQNNSLTGALTRLATGVRINTGKDDPAGLIASETMRAEKRAIAASLTNIQRSNNVVSVAESSLGEVSNLLTDLEDLVDRSSNDAGLSDDERHANQLQIDAILDSINRIASSTELQGRRLLNGTFAYTTSGVSTSAISNLQVQSARVPEGGSRSVVIDVISAASLATLTYISGAVGSAGVTVEVTGNLGSEVLSFGSGTTVSAMSDAINKSRELTGVSTVASGTAGLIFNSRDYGSSQFVSIKVLAGNFNLSGGSSKDSGDDANVRINGVGATTDGLRASMRSTTLSVDIDLTNTFGSTAGSSSTFVITGGGANFMISPEVSLTGMASLGLQAVTTSNLGVGSNGFLFTLGTGQSNALNQKHYQAAQQIVRDASTQIAQLRGRLGAFQRDTLDTTSNALQVTLENVTAAESSIRDADFATETSNLTRSQILVQSATNVLRLANAAPQSILPLLQG